MANRMSTGFFSRIYLRYCFAIIMSGITLVACSSDDSDADVVQLFNGQWERDCLVNNDGVSSHLDIVIIDGDSSSRTRQNYTDSGCQQPRSSTTNSVTVMYGETVTVAESGLTAQQVDLRVTEVTFTPLTESTAIDWNDSLLCDLDTYEVNMPTALPIDCEILPFGTGDLFDLWAAVDTLLYFGDRQNALTSESRPTALDINAPFRLSTPQ